MTIKSAVTGLAAGAAVGLACYAAASAASKPLKKMSIKKDADRTLKAAGALMSDIKSFLS
jgi:hypothetical protein